jgi:hypothetical protein
MYLSGPPALALRMTRRSAAAATGRDKRMTSKREMGFNKVLTKHLYAMVTSH